MSASILSTPKVPTLPQPAQTPLPANPEIPSIDSIMNTPDTPLDQQFNDASQTLAKSEGDLAGETAFRTGQETSNDLVGKKATVTDLTTQLNNLKTEADHIPLSLQNDATGRGVTAGGLAPIQTAALRNNSIRQLGVSAMLNAANGNLATAQDQVDAAVKAKFDPLKAQVAAQQAQLTALTPLMTKEEQKQAATQKAQLDDRARQITQQEDHQKTILKTLTDAASYGADSITLRNIQNATTPEAAVLAAGKYTSDPIARQQAQLNLQKTQADIRLTNANISKVLADAQKAAAGGGAAGLSPEALDQQAQNYLMTGKLSTLGNSGAAAKLAILNRAAELASGPGGVPAAAAKYAAAANAVKTRTDSLTKMLSASSNLEAQFGQLGQLADSVNTSSYRPLNALGVKFKQNLGNDDAAAYSELINTIRSDYSSMQAAVAGSKGAEYFSRAADKAIPDGLTSSQYAKIYQTLQTSSNNAQTAIQGEINNVLDSATVTQPSTTAASTQAAYQLNGQTYVQGADGLYYPK